MIRTIASLALFSLGAMPAFAQSAAPAAPSQTANDTAAPAPRPATVRVSLQTSEGSILLELEKERAPVTTANFLRYVDQKRLDGATFYRAMTFPDMSDFGLVQGGVRGDPKRVLPPIKHEPTSQTGLSHTDGAISMARGAPGTASGDFFITIGALNSLDADPSKPGDNQGFAVFGQVVEGMDVVRRIAIGAKSPTAGEGAMKGQMLVAPIRIVAARRAD